MTKVAIWCRHKDDNVIGIGADIPWKVPSDAKKFWQMVAERQIVCGRKTYLSFPQKCLQRQEIIVVTKDENFEVFDEKKHLRVSDLKVFKNWDKDLYIAGGAQIYNAFVAGGVEKLMPEIIVDCVYVGDMLPNLQGEKADISDSIAVMEKKYRQISNTYELDNVLTRIFVRKGEFVDQGVLKHLLNVIENQGQKVLEL